jgi:hypothetical protein
MTLPLIQCGNGSEPDVDRRRHSVLRIVLAVEYYFKLTFNRYHGFVTCFLSHFRATSKVPCIHFEWFQVAIFTCSTMSPKRASRVCQVCLYVWRVLEDSHGVLPY